ncbi:hypothetical protein GCM10027418_28660 [Mariniluteicoccus endophyticus]
MTTDAAPTHPAGVGIGTLLRLIYLGTGIGPFVITALVEPLGFR